MPQTPLRKYYKRWCKQTASHTIILPAGSSDNSQHALLPLLGMFLTKSNRMMIAVTSFCCHLGYKLTAVSSPWRNRWFSPAVFDCQMQNTWQTHKHVESHWKNILFFFFPKTEKSLGRKHANICTLDTFLFKRREEFFLSLSGYFRKKYNWSWKLYKQTIPFTLPLHRHCLCPY